MEKLIAATAQFPVYRQSAWNASQVGDIPYLGLTLIFTVLIFAVELNLDVRQLKTFYTTKGLPRELVHHINRETFTKSNEYGKDKFLFKIVESTFNFIQGVALVVLGYLPYAWDIATSIADRFGVLTPDYSVLFQEIVITWLFIVLLTVFDTVVTLPFSLYGTFVVEEKHGFNKSTLALFIQDKAMALGLTFVLGLPVLSLVVWIIRIGGPHFYYYVWACLCVVSIVLMTIYPTLIAPLFNKYTPLEDGEVKTAIEDLAKKVQFPLTNLFTVDGSRRSAHSNAYFYGFFKVETFLFLVVVLQNRLRDTDHNFIYKHFLQLITLAEQAHRAVRHSYEASGAAGAARYPWPRNRPLEAVAYRAGLLHLADLHLLPLPGFLLRAEHSRPVRRVRLCLHGEPHACVHRPDAVHADLLEPRGQDPLAADDLQLAHERVRRRRLRGHAGHGQGPGGGLDQDQHR